MTLESLKAAAYPSRCSLNLSASTLRETSAGEQEQKIDRFFRLNVRVPPR